MRTYGSARDEVEQPGRAPDAVLQRALGRLDALLEHATARARETLGPHAQDPYRGMYVSDRDLTMLLGRDCGAPILWEIDEAMRVPLVDEGFIGSRWETMAKLFGLSPLDLDALLLSVAPEIDLRYERLYAFLQDDVTRKRPTPDLVLSLRCASLQERLRARRRFMPEAPLIRNEIVHLASDSAHVHAAPIAQAIVPDVRVLAHLLGCDEPDAALAGAAWWEEVAEGVDAPSVGSDILGRLADAARDGASTTCIFYGPHDCGKRAAAKALCASSGLQLLVIDVARLLRLPQGIPAGVRLVLREARLHGGATYWKGAEALLEIDSAARWDLFADALAEHPGLAIVATTLPLPQRIASHGRVSIVEFDLPSAEHRASLWARCAAERGLQLQPAEASTLANTFRLGAKAIETSVAWAAEDAWLRRGSQAPCLAELYASVRRRSGQIVRSAVTKLEPRHGWDDLVLPGRQTAQLRALCDRVRHRHRVYDWWGFDAKLSLGKGLTALFAGPSGTGKTMAAEVVARELGVDVYRIDLAGVVSKYIGETEKNLDQIFAEARRCSAILFFDEADALFGRRSDVQDAHDRYANIEVSYLLQAMESYDGIAILATNLQQNMDEAFGRRIAFVVEFPPPDADARFRLWRSIWPSATPLADDLDFEFLARRLCLTGGSIKNIAVAAAFSAAANGGSVTMAHVASAAGREYLKLGKVCTETDFGPYLPLVSTL